MEVAAALTDNDSNEVFGLDDRFTAGLIFTLTKPEFVMRTILKTNLDETLI